MSLEDSISHVAAFPVVDMTDVEGVFSDLAYAARQVSHAQQAVVELARVAIEFHDAGNLQMRDDTIAMLDTMLNAMDMRLAKLESFDRTMLAVLRTTIDQIRAAQLEALSLIWEIKR